jgi:hypothetical protein
MQILNKEAILAAQDIKTEEVDVPEWGGAVRIAVMSGRARDQFVADNDAQKVEYSLFQARLLVATVVDEVGNPVFANDDIEPLRGKSRAALDRLTDAATKLNKMGAESVDDAEKNSDASLNAGSTSA